MEQFALNCLGYGAALMVTPWVVIFLASNIDPAGKVRDTDDWLIAACSLTFFVGSALAIGGGIVFLFVKMFT